MRQGIAKRDVLEYIRTQNDSRIPAYIVHLGKYVAPKYKQFWSERDLERSIERLERVCLVTIHGHGNFITITEDWTRRYQ